MIDIPKAHWNMLVPSPRGSLSEVDESFEYAVAYLDSATRLCRVLARSYRRATFARGAVVMYLTAHAVELFLKAAILKKRSDLRLGHHDFEQLHATYEGLYPEKRFRFTRTPFNVQYLGMTKTEAREAKKTAPPMDQLYRYPVDKQGNSWNAAIGIEPGSALKWLQELDGDFFRLRAAYDAS
jgi:hypothetical protein